MKKCIICRKDEAVVPDRDSMSNRKKVCRKCHGERLKGDLAIILDNHAKLVEKFRNKGKL